ncbi:MAG: response regulator [Deltaproteobacteria bacterium]|nr:response regulator [Deltaproteobacteria bacterium]
MKKILLQNCEPHLRQSLSDYLDKQPGSFHLLTSSGREETLALLRNEEIFLVIIAGEESAEYPLGLLERITADHPRLATVLILPSGCEQLRQRIPAHPCLQILEKPFDPTSITRLLSEHSTSRHKQQGFVGTLKITQLHNLVQMCCLAGASISIRVNDNFQQGEIFIRDGEIVHASCDDTMGEEAFYTIMNWHGGDFETLDGVADGLISIRSNYEYLLLESARRKDELGRIFTDEDFAPDDGLKTADSFSGPNRKIRVLIVEDSMVMAKIMSSMLLVAEDMEIAGIARNGREALQMMANLTFDLILLDVNMPVMNGSVTMKHIMIKSPCPIVVMSNVGSGSAEAIIALLDLGAADFIGKPVKSKDPLLQQQNIVACVRQAAGARPAVFQRFRGAKTLPCQNNPVFPAPPANDALVLVFSGCSGHGALYHLATGLPQTNSPMFIGLSSIPGPFIPAFSEHLAGLCRCNASPVTDAFPLQNGRLYLGSSRSAGHLQATGQALALSSRQAASRAGKEFYDFDSLLTAAADGFSERLLVVLLSGAETGDLNGLRRVRDNGGRILVQRRSSCMMPDSLVAVFTEDLHDQELEPEALAGWMVAWINTLT